MKSVLLVCAGLALSACAGGSLIYYSDYGRYSGSTALVAAPNGEMPLAVYGNPTAAPPAVFAAAVGEGLDGTHVDHRTRFIPTAMPNPSGYRTVVVFGETSQQSICQYSGSPDDRAEAPGPMAAAFCLGEEALSYVSGRIAALSGPDDPALAQQMSITGVTLFPQTHPDYSEECEYETIICR